MQLQQPQQLYIQQTKAAAKAAAGSSKGSNSYEQPPKVIEFISDLRRCMQHHHLNMARSEISSS